MPRYDEHVIKARLARIARAAEQIARDTPATVDGFGGPDGELRSDALEHRLVVALQAVIDIATHLCAAEGFGAPASYRDAIEELGRRQIIEGDLAGRLASGVGLRNLLIHEYLDLDPARVLDALRRVDDLKRFAAAVSEFIGV